MDHMGEIKFWLNTILSPISLILNLVLIYFIKNYSSKNLENYKKVLCFGWLTDFVFAFWNILFHPDMKLIGGIYFIVTRGFLGPLSGLLTDCSFIGSVFLMYFSVINIAIQFIYRYLLLCWKITLNLMSFLLLIGIGVAPLLWYLYAFVHQLITRTKSDEIYAHLLNESDWIKNGKLPTFGAYNLVPFGNTFYIPFFLTLISCLIIIICGIEIFRKMFNDTEKFNTSGRSYQKQITIVMTIEAIIPFFTIAFPILLDLTAIMFDMYIPWAGKIAFLIGGFAPFINPIVKLSIISCYRKQLIKIFHFILSPMTTPVQTFATQTSSK